MSSLRSDDERAAVATGGSGGGGSGEWYRDPLRLGASLSDEERLVAASARRFAEDELRPRILTANRTGAFDRSVLAAMGGAGLLGITLPPDVGGAGLGYVSYGLAAREVERVDSSYRSAMSVQSSLVMGAIDDFGSPDQRERYLPRLATGELVGAFGLTEPDHGSDPGQMRARARRDGADHLLSGSKHWITNAPVADLLVVWARDDAGEVRGFLVERGDAGLSTPPIEGKFALRASSTGSVYLDDVRIPPDRVLPRARGLRGPFACLNRARYGIAWGALGAAEDCFDVARGYALDRRLFGAPLAAKQLAQVKLADQLTDIALGLQAALRVGRLLEAGEATPEMVSLIKRRNCAAALAAARAARDMLGGNGVQDEYRVVRHLLNLEAVSTYEGTGDVHALILGRAITGELAF